MRAEEWICGALEKLRTEGLYRSLRTYPAAGGTIRIGSETILNFSSNDYLDLARDPRLAAAAEAAVRAGGAGAGASRLVSGSLPWHDKLEAALADHKGYRAALLFGSGFLANAGVVPALVGRGDHVFVDRLSHASIVDAAVLSRARIHRFHHNDPDHLKELVGDVKGGGRRLIVTESVFSMDGDLAPLAEIASVAERAGAMLMVDEAHATGVFGPAGSGCVPAANLQSSVTVCMGTLSKAFGGYGGFVACSEEIRAWLINTARTFIYTTALPPAIAAAALAALSIVKEEPGRGTELLRRAQVLRDRLRQAGLCTGCSASPVIPIIVGDNKKAVALSSRLRNAGVLAVAIRPPTVPLGTARLRLSVTLAHTEADLARAADCIVNAARTEGVV